MSRINTNVASMNAIHKLVANNDDLGTRLKRLSSGLRITAGKDDPAGLIASEKLRSEMAGIRSGISNSIRASSVIATAEGALNEISSLLVNIKELLVQTANKGGLSQEEIDANQLQVDSAINTIQRIANATEFEGMKLLNGNKAYTLSQVSATFINALHVNAAKLIDGAAMTVDVKQVSAANTGLMYMSGAGLAALDQMAIQIGSNRGNTELSFAGSTTIAEMTTAINNVREVTGVSAFLSAGRIALRSIDFGSEAYVSLEVLSGNTAGTGVNISSAVGGAHNRDVKIFGVNAIAMVNGSQAIADGKKLTIRTAMLDAELDLNGTAALSAADWSTTFHVTGGGTDFAIGSKVDAIGMESIGIMNVAPSQLGNATDGYLNTLKSGADNALAGDNLYTAQRIVDDAISNISTLRGRLGAFQKNILDTNVNSLRVTLENVTSAESAIRDADFATETAAMTRSQILVQANTSVLSMANTLPQSVLALLG